MARRTLTRPGGAAAAEMFFPEAAAAAKKKRAGTIKPPAGYRIDYGLIEAKSRRVQLLMQPSLYDKVKEAATAQGISFNDYVHQLLEKSLETKEE